MNKLFKKVLSFALSAAMVAGLVVAVPQKAEAAEDGIQLEAQSAFDINSVDAVSVDTAGTPVHFDSSKVYIVFYPQHAGKNIYTDIRLAGSKKSTKVTSVKSSNKAVTAKVVVKNGEKVVRLKMKAKQLSSTITVKVNNKTIKCKFYAYKYANPFKSYKIGSKEMKSGFNKGQEYKSPKAYKKQTVTIKTNSNWVIYRAYIKRNGKIEDIDYKKFPNKITLKNISLNSKSSLIVYAYNKKTGVYGPWYIHR